MHPLRRCPSSGEILANKICAIEIQIKTDLASLSFTRLLFNLQLQSLLTICVLTICCKFSLHPRGMSSLFHCIIASFLHLGFIPVALKAGIEMKVMKH